MFGIAHFYGFIYLLFLSRHILVVEQIIILLSHNSNYKFTFCELLMVLLFVRDIISTEISYLISVLKKSLFDNAS